MNSGAFFCDSSGNLIRTDRDGKTLETMTHDAMGRGHTKFDYDANGNLVKLIDANEHETLFVYDDDDRLISKTDAENNEVTFSYNDNGLPATRTSARGITAEYFYDENNNLIRTAYSDSTPEVVYTYDDFNRVHTGDRPCRNLRLGQPEPPHCRADPCREF